MSDLESAPVTGDATLPGRPGGAHAGTAITEADGNRAAVVTVEDLVSEVGW
ncbi:MAG TPA: hypothetical protein VH589_13995 [Trebonia sp.]